MTKGEAIKILNKYDLNFCDIDGNPIPPQDLAEAFDMAIEALEQQTAKCDNCKYSEETDGMNCYECVKGISNNFEELEKEPKWIPVTERLPETGEIVLITETSWTVRGIDVDWWNGEQWVRNGQYVIAWQPLPEPYTNSN